MEELDAVEEEALFSFSLPQPEAIGIPMLQIKEVGSLLPRLLVCFCVCVCGRCALVLLRTLPTLCATMARYW